MIKAVIFDLDGTLYDYEEAHKPALDHLMLAGSELLEMSITDFSDAYEWGKKQVKNLISATAASHNRLLYIENALEHLGFKPAMYALELYDAYWDTFLNHMRLREGVVELLDYLLNNHTKISLCSDLTAHIQYRKLKRLGIEKYFDYIVTSEEAGVEKPNERIFHLALDKLGVSPKEAVFIGDTIDRDIQGAEKVCMRAHLYSKDAIKQIINSINAIN